MCCNQNKIMLPPIPSINDLPDTFKNLILETYADTKYFWKHICMFNLGMAMALLQVPHNATVYKGQCSVIWIFGQAYQRMGPMKNPDENPWCLQTWFYDVEMQTKIRAECLNWRFFWMRQNHFKNMTSSSCWYRKQIPSRLIEKFHCPRCYCVDAKFYLRHEWK